VAFLLAICFKSIFSKIGHHKQSNAIEKDNQETKSLFWEYYKGILPLFMIGMVVIYFSRDFIIQIGPCKE
jgi:hypothetical protein